MSLIFTASSQKEYDENGDALTGGGTEIGLERPSHYTNNLRQTLKIPPMSKVAVQSVEFDRKQVSNITENDKMEWYIGEILAPSSGTGKTMGECVSTGMPIELKDASGSIDDEDYNRQELATFLQKQLRQYILCPTYFNTAEVAPNTTDRSKFDMTIKSIAKADISAAGGGDGLGVPGTGDIGDSGNATAIKSWFDPTEATDGDDPGTTKFSALTDDGDNLIRESATTVGATNPQWEQTECSPICRSYPVSVTNGEVLFAFNDPTAGAGDPTASNCWDIGFTRAVTYDADFGTTEGRVGWESRVQRPAHANGSYDDITFPVMDFMVSYRFDPTQPNADAGTSKKQLRCYQLVSIVGGGEEMKEVQYYQTGGSGGSNAPTAILDEDDLAAGGLGTDVVERIRFKFIGECIKVTLENNAGTEVHVLCDSSDATGRDKLGVWKSIDMNQWALYPRINMSLQNQNTHIYKYETDIPAAGRNRASGLSGEGVSPVDSWDYPMDGQDHLNTADYTDVFTPGHSWWANRYLQKETQFELDPDDPDSDQKPLQENTRVTLKQELISDRRFNKLTEDSPWVQLDTGNENPNYISVLMVNKTNIEEGRANLTPTAAVSLGIDPSTIRGIYACDNGTMGELLGFPSNPRQSGALSSGTTSDRAGGNTASTYFGKWVFTSPSSVAVVSKTLLISCPTLTHQSYNFCINAPSKFLYHCPRITESGKSFGRMFFEPHEKTYLDLNNPESLYVQDLEILLTDKNGVPADDLQGSTSVCLHIKQ